MLGALRKFAKGLESGGPSDGEDPVGQSSSGRHGCAASIGRQVTPCSHGPSVPLQQAQPGEGQQGRAEGSLLPGILPGGCWYDI